LAILPSTIFSITAGGLPVAAAWARKIYLALEVFGGYIFRPHVAGIARSDVHGDILEQILKVFGARNEVAFAVHFDEHAEFTASVDVRIHRAVIGRTRSLLLRRSHATLAQHHERVFNVSLGFLQRLEAITHGRAGLFAKLFYLFCINLFSHSHSSSFPFENNQPKSRRTAGAKRKAWHLNPGGHARLSLRTCVRHLN
jgi:hypothetical protein